MTAVTNANGGTSASGPKGVSNDEGEGKAGSGHGGIEGVLGKRVNKEASSVSRSSSVSTSELTEHADGYQTPPEPPPIPIPASTSPARNRTSKKAPGRMCPQSAPGATGPQSPTPSKASHMHTRATAAATKQAPLSTGEEEKKWAVEVAKRRDFRADLVFTIDPPTARDLDDAIHCKQLCHVQDATTRLGVCTFDSITDHYSWT